MASTHTLRVRGVYALLASASAITHLAAAPPASAQAAEPAQQNASTPVEIIVTAQKREQDVLEVPLAVTALGGDFLRDRGVQDVVGLQNFAPGLNVGRVGNFAKVTIRGVSNEFQNLGGDAGVAFHLDGIFIGRAEAQLAGFYDVNRVEVLKGPQGTLYGRNATGGSINVIYNRPTHTPEGYLSGSYGSFNEYDLEAAASGPISPHVLGRLSLMRQYDDGYTDNALGSALDDKDSFATRAQIQLEPSDDVSLLLSADYYHDRSRGAALKFIGGPDGAPTPPELPPFNGRTVVPLSSRDVAANNGQREHGEFWGVRSELDWSLPTFDFKSISSYRSEDYGFKNVDLDGTDLRWSTSNSDNNVWQVSQEFQLVSTGDSALQWILGAYYYAENGDQVRHIPIFQPGPLALFAGGEVRTDAYAAYGHVDYSVTPEFTLALGARYSLDRRSNDDFLIISGTPVSGTSHGAHDWDAFTWDVALSYQLSSDAMAYVRAARGFKSGGFNTGALQPDPFNPEHILSWELGYKRSFLNRRLDFTSSVFLNDYNDLQVTQPRGFALVLTNAARARMTGAELELAGQVTDNLRINVAASYLDAQFRNYTNVDQARPAKGLQDLAGNTLPNAPMWKVTLGADYTHNLASGAELTFGGAYYFQDKIYFDGFNENQASQDAVGRFDAEVSYLSPDKAWRISVFGRNLTDELVRSAAIQGSNVVGSPTFVIFDPPRTFGVSVRREF